MSLSSHGLTLPGHISTFPNSLYMFSLIHLGSQNDTQLTPIMKQMQMPATMTQNPNIADEEKVSSGLTAKTRTEANIQHSKQHIAPKPSFPISKCRVIPQKARVSQKTSKPRRIRHSFVNISSGKI